MSITAEKTVREVVLENPAATGVFEKLGIDYCCGGSKSLEEACRTANLPMDEVLNSLEMAGQSAGAVQKKIVTGRRRYWLTWLRTSSVLITSTRARDGSPRSVLQQGLLRAPEKPSGTAAGSGQFSWAGAGIDDAHDEGGEGPVSLHSTDGRVGHPEGTSVAAAFWQRAEPGDNDDP